MYTVIHFSIACCITNTVLRIIDLFRCFVWFPRGPHVCGVKQVSAVPSEFGLQKSTWVLQAILWLWFGGKVLYKRLKTLLLFSVLNKLFLCQHHLAFICLSCLAQVFFLDWCYLFLWSGCQPREYDSLSIFPRQHKMEREWILSVLEEGISDGHCYELCEKQGIFQTLLGFSSSPLCDEHCQVHTGNHKDATY